MKRRDVLLGLSAAGLSSALPGVSFALPTSGKAPRVPVEQYQLDNGLTVLLSRDPQLPVVAVEMRYLVGSSHERPGKSGFAHLFEHLMFQGSKNFDGEYFKPFEPIGGQVNGTTNQDRTNYFERVPSNYLEMALWMESDRLFNFLPVLSQAKLDNQRDVVKNERRQRYENTAYGMSWVYLTETLFPKQHPYHEPVIGSHQDLTNASLEDVKDFFREYYVPSNAVLSIVGDFDQAKTKRMVERYFIGGTPGKRAATPKPAAPSLSKVEHITRTDDVKLPRIMLAWHTPALFAPGDAELDLLSSVLTTGKTSRLYKPLVYDQKVAKDVSAFQVSMHLSSFYVVQATAAPGVKIDKLEKALLAALGSALEKAPSDDEMQRAKNGYKKDFYERVESVLSRASTLATYYQVTGKADYLAADMARYTGASATDVHAAAKRFLTMDKYARIDIVPGPKAGGGAP